MRKLTAVAFLVSITVAVGALALPALPAQASDATVPSMVARLFADRPDTPFVSLVLRDPANRQYLAYHISTYLELKELRVYRVPFVGADAEGIDAALAKGDHEVAFQKVLTDMRVDLGASYVADVALDGIRDEDVPLGTGRMRDNFHRGQFADFAAADASYLQWLQRGLELLGS